jgi:hypothetical protein
MMGRSMGCASALLGVACLATAAPIAKKSPPAKKSAATSSTSKSAAKSTGKTVAAKTKAAKKRKPNAAMFSTPDDATTSAAYRYGQLSQEDCEAELAKRKISFVRETALGVRSPVRLTAPLDGIVFRTNQADAKRATSRWEIADCALVLAMDDFADILARHDVVDVRHYSMYRPPPASWPAAEIAKRHPGAVALDAARFIRKDGSYLDVEEHFHGEIGRTACKDPPEPATPEATALHAILCETIDARLFNVVLTPNYNRAHRNHFHLEVTRDVKWFMVD